MANCCNPLPGDEIIGYISKNNGITVHRMNCPNIERLEDRMISVNWSDNPKSKYLSSILINTKKNDKAMLEIMQKASISNIPIYNIKTLSRTDVVIYEVDFKITSLERLNIFIRDLCQLSYVNSVERTMR
jgi:GTP pyrophosphokinase